MNIIALLLALIISPIYDITMLPISLFISAIIGSTIYGVFKLFKSI